MGITHPVTPGGVFPPAPPGPHPAGTQPDHLGDWTNYRSADSEPDVTSGLLDRMVQKGWATRFPSQEAAVEACGGSPPLQQAGLVVKSQVGRVYKTPSHLGPPAIRR